VGVSCMCVRVHTTVQLTLSLHKLAIPKNLVCFFLIIFDGEKPKKIAN